MRVGDDRDDDRCPHCGRGRVVVPASRDSADSTIDLRQTADHDQHDDESDHVSHSAGPEADSDATLLSERVAPRT